jgi:tetratricopeptide (TPR) repeat protein
MGDGIMALFGAPLAHEDHGVRACYAALAMQEAIGRYTEELRRAHGLEVRIRGGLNSGEVVVRSIGSDLRMDYTAVGQTTHLAARMEQLANPGTIRLTAETLRLAEGYVTVQPLGPIPVKGLAAPVEVYELRAAAPARTRLQVSRSRGLTRFVGRDGEMEQLREAAAQAQRGRGQIVAVVGEPGVGKSRLYYEFLHSHHAAGWLALESGSVSYGKATPYLPLADLLRAYLKIEARDDIRAIRAKVTGTLLTLDETLHDAIPPVLWLLDALPEDSAFLVGDPAARRRRTLEAAKRILLRESQVQPLLLVLEDLHWIDSETQAFLDSLVESLPATPILLAVNYRPEYRHDWGGKTYYRQLRIDPLRPESAEGLLEGLLGGDPSVTPLCALLIQRTEGNPLFLEESVRELVETGALTGTRGAYRLTGGVERLRVPPTVQAIIAARIDRLGAADKRFLQAAAVVGTDVPFSLLEAIAESEEGELHHGLTRLQAAEFLYESRLFPEREYTFKHALTHDVTYASVLHERRRALHAAIVAAIERLHGDRLAEHVEVLAHHAVRGNVPDKAVHYLHQAGAKLARAANREAAGFLEQALALLPQLPETPATLSEALSIRLAFGPALLSLKGTSAPEVKTVYEEALKLADRLGDPSRQFPALWGLWFTNYSRGLYPAAQELGERLLETAASGTDTGRRLEAHHSLWATLGARGHPTAAIAHMEQGQALYDREQHSAQMFLYGGHDAGACSYYQMAMNRWLLGQPDQAVVALDRAFRISAEVEHPLTVAINLWCAAWLRYQRGERAAAVAEAGRLGELGRTHGFLGWIDAAIVMPHTVGDDRMGAEELAALHRRLVAARGATWRHVFCLCILAELYGEAGDPEGGRRVLASISAEDRGAFYGPEVYRLDGELLLRGVQPAADEAARSFRAAMDLARQRAAKGLELRAATSLARLYEGQGRRAEAGEMLAEVYGHFTEGLDTADLQAARSLLAALA